MFVPGKSDVFPLPKAHFGRLFRVFRRNCRSLHGFLRFFLARSVPSSSESAVFRGLFYLYGAWSPTGFCQQNLRGTPIKNNLQHTPWSPDLAMKRWYRCLVSCIAMFREGCLRHPSSCQWQAFRVPLSAGWGNVRYCWLYLPVYIPRLLPEIRSREL